MTDEVRQRKAEHVSTALRHDVSSPQAASWADVHLVHQALPEVDLDEVDLAVDFLGRHLAYPVVVSALTGGHPGVAAINERLADLAQKYGLAMGVGSQRAALVNPELAPTYAVVRERAPDAFLIANIGAPQLIAQRGHAALTTDDVRRAVGMIRADALAVHLNFLQEAAQPEGDRKAEGALAVLGRVAAQIGVPVIAKETGAGVGFEQAQGLATAGVAAIDVGGAGGSSMAALELARAQTRGAGKAAAIGETFRDWGIATPIALVEAIQGAPGLPIIATGGVRSGLDAARALALGATVVGVGFPFLQAASEGTEALQGYLERFVGELRVALQLSGAASVADLRWAPVVVTGATREWLELRGFGEVLRTLARRDR